MTAASATVNGGSFDGEEPMKKTSMASIRSLYGSRPSSFVDSSTAGDDRLLVARRRRNLYHVTNYETRFFSNITTYHGLVRIYHSKWWVGRLFWAFVIIFSLVFYTIHAYTLLHTYGAKNTITQVNLVVPDNGLVFPDVTICNYGPVSKKILQKNDEYPPIPDAVLSYLLMAFLRVENVAEQYDTTRFGSLQDAFMAWTCRYRRRNCRKFDFYTFFEKAAFRCEDLVEWCTFGGMDVKNCCYFSRPVMTDLGQCFRFTRFGNLSSDIYQRVSGAFFGLHMLLNLNFRSGQGNGNVNYTDIGECRCGNSSAEYCGEQCADYPSDPAIEFDTKQLDDDHDQMGDVGLKFQFKLLSRENYGVCETNWDNMPFGPDNGVFDGVNYTASYCEAYCVGQMFLSICGCMPMSYYFKRDSTAMERSNLCAPDELYSCAPKIRNATEAQKDKYRCRCLVECDRMHYDMSLSYSDLPKKMTRYNTRQKDNKSSSDYVSLSIFINAMFYERNTQLLAVSRSDLLSNVGGSMGLFMGMSIITLMEIFIFILKTMWGFVWKPRSADLKQREDGITADLEEELAAQNWELSEEYKQDEHSGHYNDSYLHDPLRIRSTNSLYSYDNLAFPATTNGSLRSFVNDDDGNRPALSSLIYPATSDACPHPSHAGVSASATQSRHSSGRTAHTGHMCEHHLSPMSATAHLAHLLPHNGGAVRSRAVTFAAAAATNAV